MSSTVLTVSLHNGRPIPQVGLGTWQVSGTEATSAVRVALAKGYRLIDTAAASGNEREVGEGIRAAGIFREEIFVTSRLWNDLQGYDAVLRGLERSLERLGLDYVDLFLIHWPVPKLGKYLETWRALSQLREEGRTKSIGVSNFTVAHLERIIGETGDVPLVNRIELNPRFPRHELRAFHARHRIVTQSWSPLARGELLSEPRVAELAARHGKTPAQVLIRWQLEQGLVVIPKSSNAGHIEENLQVFDFRLSEEDLAELAILETETSERVEPGRETFSGT